MGRKISEVWKFLQSS